MSKGKRVNINVTDSSNIYKISKNSSQVDLNLLAKSLDQDCPDVSEKIYVYMAKMYESEDFYEKKGALNSFTKTIQSFGWNTICVNEDNFLIFRSNSDGNTEEVKKYNLSQTLKSIYLEQTTACMTLQELINKYSFEDGFHDSVIKVNFILYNDTYNYPIKMLHEIFEHVDFCIYTTKDKIGFFSREFELCKNIKVKFLEEFLYDDDSVSA